MSSLSLCLSSSLSMSSSLLTKGKGESHNYLVGRGSSEMCPLCPINYFFFIMRQILMDFIFFCAYIEGSV